MRISPLALLGALLGCFYFQAVVTQSMDISLPPEDLDSSGDDDESFSGSGVGPLTESPVVALNVPLQRSANTSLKPEVSTDLRDTQPKTEVTNSPVEDYSRVLLSTASRPVFQTNDLVSSKPTVIIEDDYLDSVIEPEAPRPTIITGVPITHNATSRTASTVKIIEHDYHVPYSVSSIDKTSAFDIVPANERNLNPTRASTVFSTVQTDSSPLFEKEALPSEDGSGGQEDFTFPQSEENPINVKESGAGKVSIDTEAKDAKSEGAPQGIMDRKEVLGGVIAGGLVGLLFAGFLVGFMLYRMKKKDEGSYSLDEPKQSNGGYQKPHKQEEFYA